MQTILLSGVSGFLGSNLAEALHKNYEIIGLKRSTSNCHRLQNLTIKTYNIDKIKLDSIFNKHKIDIIIHTATCYGRRGEPLSHLVETNLVFSLKLLELARKFNAKAFINADTLQLDSVSNYTISKRTLRDYLHNFSDINLINCRIEHIYGNDKDNSKFSTYLLDAFSDNVPYIPLTSGKQRRDFIYIDDVVRAFELILRSAMEQRNERSYDIGSGEFISVRSFAECLLSEFRKHKSCKTRLNFGAIPYTNLGEIKENLAPLRALGFMAKYSYQSGIRALIEAYLQNQKNYGDTNHIAKVYNAKDAKNRKWGGAESRFLKESFALYIVDSTLIVFEWATPEACIGFATHPHLQIHTTFAVFVSRSNPRPFTVFARRLVAEAIHKNRRIYKEILFLNIDCHANPYGLSRNDGIDVDCHDSAVAESRNDASTSSLRGGLSPKQSITFNPCEIQKDSTDSNDFSRFHRLLYLLKSPLQEVA